MLYIGIDLGTTCCKARLYDETGKVLGENSISYPLIASGKNVEQDANAWFNAVKENIKALVPFATDEIAAISFSTQGISFVPVDKDGAPLANAITWLDTRAETETESLKDAFGSEYIYKKTGKPMLSVYTLPKLIWFMKNCPSVYEKAYKLLMPLDFLNFKFTGKAVTDISMASGTMLYDIHNRKWDEELLKFSGISSLKLPDILPAGTEIGRILPQLAKELGISAETSIVMGSQDQKLAAFGAGISEGLCTVSIGTATAISKINATKNAGFPLFAYNDNIMFAETSISTTGAAIEWLSRVLGLSYKEMDELARQSPKGSNGVVFDLNLSVSGSIQNLNLGITKGDIIRALYESIATEITNKVRQMGGANYICVFGGGSNSDILNQILADTSGIEVCVMETAETATLGAVMLASGGVIGCSKIRRRFKC